MVWAERRKRMGRFLGWSLVWFVAVLACSCRGPQAERTDPLPLRLDRTPPYLSAESRPAPDPSGGPPAAMAYRLRPGDSIVVIIHTPAVQQFEIVLDENGIIKLPLIPDIRAAGLTGSELERYIKNAYVSNKIYRDVTVNVVIPQRSYFVRGEVRAPGRYPLSSGLTLMQALAAAGGYTEFANPRRVQILRGGATITVDARDPDQDVAIETGDIIIVPRSVL